MFFVHRFFFFGFNGLLCLRRLCLPWILILRFIHAAGDVFSEITTLRFMFWVCCFCSCARLFLHIVHTGACNLCHRVKSMNVFFLVHRFFVFGSNGLLCLRRLCLRESWFFGFIHATDDVFSEITTLRFMFRVCCFCSWARCNWLGPLFN